MTNNLLNDIKKSLNPALKAQAIAFEKFKEVGIPTTKHENWKYTNISRALPESYKMPQKGNLEFSKIKDHIVGEQFIVIYNGRYSSDLTTLPTSVKIEEIDNLKSNPSETFEALSECLAHKTILITIEKNCIVEKPIHILHYTDEKSNKTICSSKVAINAEKLSKSFIYQSFVGPSFNQELVYTSLSQTEVNLDAGANLEFIKGQLESPNSSHIGIFKGNISKDASLNSISVNLGGSICRNNIELNLNELGAHATAHGLFATRNEQHSDAFSTINHHKSHTTSHQLYKGILDDQSRGAFTGKVMIHKDAQLVNSEQLNKNILLSKKAKVDTRPQLEVYADDVKCAHGATVGQISEDEIFYLESRGIKKEKAMQILCHAFACDVLDKIENKTVKSALSNNFFDFFEKHSIGTIEGITQ